jgi:1-deoxy-D-xylulose-5-phosphate reductoisomerase
VAAGVRCDIASGHEAIHRAVESPQCDITVSAMTGLTSIDASLHAARAGKRLLLANKESMVIAGSLFRCAVTENGGEIIPLSPGPHATSAACIEVSITWISAVSFFRRPVACS